MKIWLVSPAWGRYAVTRLTLAERRWLCDELADRGHEADSVIVADDENIDIAREYGFHTVRMANDDLGRKFNVGYIYAAQHGADLFVHVGSDDWIHPDLFDVLDRIDLSCTPEPDFPPPGAEAAVWRDEPCVLFQRSITLANLQTGELQLCETKGHYGNIPWLIPRAVMEHCRFAPIRAGLMRGIDGALVRGLRIRPNWISQEVDPYWIVDWKSETNLTPFAILQHNIGVGDPVPLDDLAQCYPAELVAMAEELAAVAA